jgi:hypothetical protein
VCFLVRQLGVAAEPLTHHILPAINVQRPYIACRNAKQGHGVSHVVDAGFVEQRLHQPAGGAASLVDTA